MKLVVFDIETDGLLDTISKFHCGALHVMEFSGDSIIPQIDRAYIDLERFVLKLEKCVDEGYALVGHYILLYDFPAMIKLAGFEGKPQLIPIIEKLQKNCIDTLPLAWHIWWERSNNKQSFGLADIGEYFGTPKPVIEDWVNLSTEEYLHRCVQDVKINTKLIVFLMKRLYPLYDNNEGDILRYTSYLNFKMNCAREQEEIGWNLNINKAVKHFEECSYEYNLHKDALESIMPKIPVYSTSVLPKNLISTSKRRTSGYLNSFLNKFYSEGTMIDRDKKKLKLIKKHEEPNAGSSKQIKDFLFSLGWNPDVFKVNEKGEFVPQVSAENKELTESVKALISVEPNLKYLEGMNLLAHRKGIFNGFIDNYKDGKIIAGVAGLTNTLRFKHRTIVNLPGVDKPWGEQIRGCLESPGNNYVLLGCDMVSLEDTTKQHYMYFFDPEYVDTMRTPGFDPHLDLAEMAGMLTPEEIRLHKTGEKSFNKERQNAKKANYSCTYGVGIAKLADSTGLTEAKARELHEAYWERNKAITMVANSALIKETNFGRWIFNPVSRFWYPLRSEKDRFSTLNQGLGVYAFDRFIYYVRKAGIKICGQMHDEIISPVAIWDQENTSKLLDKAIEQVNEELQLNVPLRIDYKYGRDYSKVH